MKTIMKNFNKVSVVVLVVAFTLSLARPVAAPVPATLHVIKQVVNNSDGTATVSLFNLHVKLSGTDVAGSPAAGTAAPGTSYSLLAGTYVVSEDTFVGYVATFSGDCDANGSVTLLAGENKTCTITNDDIAPVPPPASGDSIRREGTITVVKMVINDSDGTKTVDDFPLSVNGTLVASATTYSFPASDVYAVTENTDPNYTRTFSGDCDINGRIELNVNENKFCIVTNDDIGAPVVPPVPPLIAVVKVPNPLALPGGPGLVEYTYTLRNIGTVPVTNVTMVGDTCIPITLTSGDSNADARLDVSETWIYNCSTTLSETHTNTVVATGWANGLSATDIASATVVVGVPVLPPLIHITNVPSPLTLPAGGGMVTYTRKVTNPGIVALSNVLLTDDKCSSVKYVSGDTNSDSKLDTTETWIYTCRTNLTKTTINTIIVSGDANDLTARDLAIATVVLADVVPAIPNMGLPPEGKSTPWDIVIFSGIFILASISFVIFLRKRTI